MTTSSSTNAGSSTEGDAPRKQWMAVLAKAPAKRVESLAAAYLDGVPDASAPRFRVLRRPETGLVMVRARAGGTGDPFNMGEMTVTRCTVVLERDGAAAVAGHAYIAGRNRAHATLAAKLDALLQTDSHHDPLMVALVEPLAREAEERRAVRRRRVGATKVDFFTLVRGED